MTLLVVLILALGGHTTGFEDGSRISWLHWNPEPYTLCEFVLTEDAETPAYSITIACSED